MEGEGGRKLHRELNKFSEISVLIFGEQYIRSHQGVHHVLNLNKHRYRKTKRKKLN
jgi:hypothetical protein